MPNPKRGEVPFDPAGEGAFFLFTFSEGEELETKFGEDFFEQIELAARNGGMKKIGYCIRLGLKKRGPDGKLQRLAEDGNFEFHWTEAVDGVLDAVSLCVANMTYGELLEKAAEAEKARNIAAIKGLKEAADEAGTPLSEEALVSALLKLQPQRG